MNYQLSGSMLETKEQKHHGIILPIFASLVMIMIGDFILMGFGFSEGATEPSMGENLASLYIDIVPIILVLLFCQLFEKRSLSSLGLQKSGILQKYGLGMLIGFLMIGATFLSNVLLKGIEISDNFDHINWLFVLLIFVGYTIQGLSEELICRGMLMNGIAAKKGVWAGVIGNSLFFAVLHLLSPGVTVISFMNILFFGLLFSYIFYKTNNIFVVAALHSVWNFFQGIIFGSEVSGLSSFSSIFKSIPVAGKDLLSGGSFGFEGGIVTTFVLIATFIIFKIVYKKR
ncbi:MULTISPECIES: CPBP family intramembrane glutamic endopeptidase [unclassified Enterococcus]|uniref:CPBP family intramembrane glutamic endopeptidase n=1 Tax=unclassified Enterococcus TaxID=2608891 RepID=UPI001CE095DC|nr:MULTISPECIES: CPBP family intramembrane glutamic endopeptidase [unclassified Enterococcus]MCA5011881.1 CPBP family intramembrane metalloprotease [Enterococcus sp. S23]MCA5014677.1 CPBP family intramembrane metalloprotease [Enterococcus sp. S22(2020)]